MIEEFGLLSAWHLTDVANVPSIMEHGLMSRKDVTLKQVNFVQVGWEKIISSRADETKNLVLTFVIPYNKFIKNRPNFHKRNHPESLGLALLEIDLVKAVHGKRKECLISNGNLAKQRLTPKIGPIDELAKILDWHAMLDRNPEESEQYEFAGQAEILIPSPIPSQSIRRVWVDSLDAKEHLASQRIEKEVLVAEEFFTTGKVLPPPAVPNFAKFKPLPPTRIRHSQYGDGTLVCNLAGKCVARFDKAGIRLIGFSEYDWI